MWDVPSKSVSIIFSATEARSLGISNIAKEETEFLRTVKTASDTQCANQTNMINRVGVKLTQTVYSRKALAGEMKHHSVKRVRKRSQGEKCKEELCLEQRSIIQGGREKDILPK